MEHVLRDDGIFHHEEMFPVPPKFTRVAKAVHVMISRRDVY